MMADHEETHPGVVGRAAELMELAETVRRLSAATVLNRAPAGALIALTDDLRAIAHQLETYVPEPRPAVTNVAGGAMEPTAASFAAQMAFDVVAGRFSPLAVPVTFTFEPPMAIGHARFPSPFEGPPGCVHGGVIAATFDIALTAANVIAAKTGPTVSLTLRYRRPTRLEVDTRFEAWVEDHDDRRVRTRGQVVQADAVTVEAEGTFALLGRERTAALAKPRRHDEPPGS
jgi:hypothetical protein